MAAAALREPIFRGLPPLQTSYILTDLHIARIGLLVPSIAVFLLPGWLLGRMYKSPFGAVTSFLGSAALVFNLILVLDALHVPLTIENVGGAFAVVTGVLILWAMRTDTLSGMRWPTMTLPVGTEWIWLIPPILASASIAARTVVEPLIGYDNSFRWDYLARLILRHHSLASYPPVSMSDFDLYSWCDGIPPLVPFLNFLIYGASGSDAPGLITIRALAEFALVAALAYRFAREIWGKEAGWPAVAVLGSCTLLVWGLAIEQETGLTAISLVAMVYFLRDGKPDARDHRFSIQWAGVAAGVGAISREYGLYFIILGAVLVTVERRVRDLARFLLPAACVAAPWYVRNWIKTGNPVFPALGAIFPTNSVHVEIMNDIADFMSYRTSPVPMSSVPWILLAISGAVWVFAFLGIARLQLRERGIVLGTGLIVALWIWSMPQTAGGWCYSMRVLLPAMVLGSILAGWIGTTGRRVRVVLAVLVGLLAMDSARRAWMLPDDPYTNPWTFSFDEWRFFRAQDQSLRRHNIWPVLVKAAAGGYIVVDSPQPFVSIIDADGHPTPLTSPRVASLFDPRLSVDQAVQRLRGLNVRFVTFSVGNPVVNKLVQRHAVLRCLADEYVPAANLKGLLIFDLEFMEHRKPAG